MACSQGWRTREIKCLAVAVLETECRTASGFVSSSFVQVRRQFIFLCRQRKRLAGRIRSPPGVARIIHTEHVHPASACMVTVFNSNPAASIFQRAPALKEISIE